MKPLKDNTETTQCTELWHFRVDDNFNAISVDRSPCSTGLALFLGGEDGIIRVHDIGPKALSEEQSTCIETKGGPIQCLTTHNVTRLGQTDVLAADSHGTLTVVCGQQILSRHSLAAHAITCLIVQEDGRGYIEIVSSTERGLITASQSSTQLWTINLNDHIKASRRCLVSVKCLLSVELPDCHGHTLQYLLVADDTPRLHLILRGQIVNSITTPAVVTAMAQGTFISSAQLPTASNSLSPGGNCKQVALGTNTGAVYILYNLSIAFDEIARAEGAVTHLAALPIPDSPLDLLLCAGHFRALCFYRQGKLIDRHPTSDWVNCLITADLDKDETKEVIVGCIDKTVYALKCS